MRVLSLVRQAMADNIPPVFEGIVEIDETYSGGNWRNKRKDVCARGAKRGRGTAKQAAFGILCRNGQMWAEVVPNGEADTLLPLLRKRVATGAIVCSGILRSCTRVAAKSCVYRLVGHERQEHSDGQGSRIKTRGFLELLKTKASTQKRDETRTSLP